MKDISKSTKYNSRRNFMKASAMAAAGFYIVPRHVIGGPGFKAPSDKLRIAGIGSGGKGGSDIRSFYESGNADIVALCDVDPKRASGRIKAHPKAKFYEDYREMLEKENNNIDAVSVSTPDHNHAVQALTAMKLGKHVYVQKPLTHTIHEARVLTQAAEKYKLVTQMGNQGASGDGVRKMREWYAAGLIGEATKVQVWTNRPVWPQGVPWTGESGKKAPKNLNWDLWLGTARQMGYVENLHPFNWRGWWEFGTGALGDMACHLMEPAFRTLDLGYPTGAECSVGSVYTGEFTKGYFPKSCPPSSHITLGFDKPNGGNLEFHWMDGGIQPSRPEELGPNEQMGDGGNGVIIEGTRGKMMCSTYGMNPKLLPSSINDSVNVAPTLPRVEGGVGGHYAQWVNACIAGHGSKEYNELSSPFSIAGPLTESVLMGNLAIKSHDLRTPKADGKGFDYPGRGIKLMWDGPNMKVTNFEPANQFVSKDYREGFELPKI